VKRSLLKVREYFVTDVDIKANPVGDAATLPPEGNSNVSTKVETAQNRENKRDWKVALQITCEPTQRNIGGYSVTMELIGFFDVDASLPEDRVEDVVAANGPAVLYGAARELVLLITGRGPFPPFSLPCATFIDETPSAQRKVAEAQRLLDLQGKLLPK